MTNKIISFSLLIVLMGFSRVFGDQLTSAQEKARVRSIINEVSAISKDCVTLEEFGKRTISQGKDILLAGSAAVYPLSGCLAGSDWKVRFWIVDMMGYLENNDAKRPLMRIIRNKNENPKVRAQAEKSLKRLDLPLEKGIQ